MNPHWTALISDIHGHYAGLLAGLADARAVESRAVDMPTLRLG